MSKNYGYIYFATAGSDGEVEAVKIGFSNTPRRRVKELQTGSPLHIKLAAWMPGTREDEQSLHRAFNEWRKDGEWFEACAPLMTMIERTAVMCGWLPSWSGLDPFPREKRGGVDAETLRCDFGDENYELTRKLVNAFGPGTNKAFADLLLQLSADDNFMHPSSKAMSYGLRAAIKQGVCKASYVVACSRRGIREGAVA